MRAFPKFLAFLLLLGCSNKMVDQAELHFLNGYWEIQQVEFPDGSTKEYTLNPTIDFISLENGEGFRKKMRPSLGGTYTTSQDTEYFHLDNKLGEFLIQYKKGPGSWEETLVSLDSLSFSVRNGEGILYTYKRFEPINIPQ